MIIEDHDDSREVLVKLMRHANFDVIAYGHCTPAERHLADRDIDIALLGVRLPDRCGDDYGKELRQRCPKTMIVFVTGEAILEPLKEAVPDCFVIRKPVDARLLLELLECFSSGTGYGSPMGKSMEERAGPGNM